MSGLRIAAVVIVGYLVLVALSMFLRFGLDWSMPVVLLIEMPFAFAFGWAVARYT